MKLIAIKPNCKTRVLSALCLLYFFCLSAVVQSGANSNKSFAGTYGGLGGFASPEGYLGGVELAATIWQEHTGFRTSGLIYSNDSYDTESLTFAGYSVTSMGYVGDRLKAYLGLGAFLGGNGNCNVYRGRQVSNVGCDSGSSHLFAVYPEFGFALDLGPFQLNPFIRVYYDTGRNGDRKTAAYGAMIHWYIY